MTTKTILAGTLTAAALALGGGAAYAATTGGGPAAPAVTTVQHAQPAATQPAGQHPATYQWRNDCCGMTGNNGAARPAAGTATPAAPRPGNSHAYRCDHGNGYGYQVSGQYSWNNGSWCCGH
jgi:hypothetical protein